MCGIVGIASNTSIVDRSWLAFGRETMKHRGPDDFGEWWSRDGRVGLGHRRLSIVDLSVLGHQPMHVESLGLTLVFNGEIYNHIDLRSELSQRGYVFRSQSDTEVLLAAYSAWGDECLHHLNGMFAFAIYDFQRNTLLLARDRAGEKPLFYRLSNGSLEFASELKALLINRSANSSIDLEALDCYLAMGFIPGSRCILQGYKKLPAAHALKFDLKDGTSKIWRYWNVPDLLSGSFDEDSLLDDLEVLIEDSVGRQLTSDVPVGVLLSGGVDSSLVTAMAVRKSKNVRTFTIGFPGYGKMDEVQHARLIARHFGTEHTELIAESTSADLIPLLACQFDEPMADSSMIPTWLASHLVRQHCTVALGGDGGDELFGGYTHYSRLIKMQMVYRCLPFGLRRLLARVGERLPEGFANSNIRNWLMLAGINLDHDLPILSGQFDKLTRRFLMQSFRGYDLVAEKICREYLPLEDDLLQRATRMDFSDYLVDDILVKVDRASMLNSLEIRAPLLDYRLIEFAFARIPSTLKATATKKKILLKRLAARVLPPEFDMDRKQGFSIPLAQWLRAGPFRDLFWDTLVSSNCLFDQRTVLKLLKAQDKGFNNAERLFSLVHFELWRRHYNVSL